MDVGQYYASRTLDFETVIVPVIDGLQKLVGTIGVEQLQNGVSLLYAILTSTPQDLLAEFGTEKGDQLWKILENDKIVQSPINHPSPLTILFLFIWLLPKIRLKWLMRLRTLKIRCLVFL